MSQRTTLSSKTIVALVVSALIAGMAVQSLIASRSETLAPSATTPDVATAGSGPWRIDGGIPAGFSHDEGGALAAASSYATTGQALIDMAPTQLPDAVRRYAATSTATEQITKVTSDVASLRQALSPGQGRTRYVKSVLATRIDTYTQDRAEVRVWAVGVLWRQGAADPQADWTTSTFDLVWEDDTWKVEKESIASGPAPAPNGGTPPVDAAELDRQLDGFNFWDVTR